MNSNTTIWPGNANKKNNKNIIWPAEKPKEEGFFDFLKSFTLGSNENKNFIQKERNRGVTAKNWLRNANKTPNQFAFQGGRKRKERKATRRRVRR